MPGPSKVIVVDPDPRSARQLQLGLTREGVQVAVIDRPDDVTADGVGLVLVGGSDVDVVRRVRARLAAPAIVFAGTGAAREAALAAGADEIVMRPAYLRDVVTVARLLAGVPAGERDHLVGSLAETTGVFTLVRALAALGRSAVLTLIRGLRRGEVRFYHGEVTSAQVGLIHGQAALHQLLLWTDARFDFQHEDIVRRQQIPLSSEELFADAEHFLDGVRESAGGLSPAMVLEQDIARVHNLGKQIPTEVHGVLRMFDGHRVLADVLEDSPYRVFETLRVAQKACEAGLLKVVDGHKPKATWRAVLAIEEWLVGKDTRDAVVERTTAAQLDSAPTPIKKFNKKKRRKKRTPPVGVAPKADIDWGALVPRVIGAEVGPLSGVVPAAGAHGEIEIASRKKDREGLELLDTDKRTRIFPTEIGVEPSVVVRSNDTDEWEKVEWEAKKKLPPDAPSAPAEAGPRASDLGPRPEQDQPEGPRASDLGPRPEQDQPEPAPAAEAPSRPTDAGDLVRKLVAEAVAPAPDPVPAPVPAPAPAPVPVAAPPPVPAPPAEVRGPTPEAPSSGPAPQAPSPDDVSDGVIRAMIATADTDQLARAEARRRPPSTPPPHDGPPIKETSGEIGRKPPPPPAADTPIADREPSILVDDLAAAHAKATAAMTHPPAMPPPADSASPSRELAVAETRKDAVAATEAEEAFFKRADQTAPHQRPSNPDTFADLDDGYEPPKFWDRVFGRKPPKK